MARSRLFGAASGVLLLGSGCEPLLDLNHDYALRSDSSGGTIAVTSGGVTSTNSDASGGVTSGHGGATSGGETTGGTDTGGAPATRTTTGGSDTGGVTATLVDAGGAATGGSAGAPATIGGAGTGGSSATRASTGGVASGGASSTRSTTGGTGTGGVASGVVTGGSSSTRASTGGGVVSGGANSGGNGGSSNCTACSHAITLQSESATPKRGSTSASGTTYTSYDDRCPSGQVLIGYAGTLRNDVHKVNDLPVLQVASLVAICGTVTLEANGAVSITPSSGITPRGTDGAAGTLSQVCSPGQAVVGFAGRSGTIVDQIGFVCASLANVASACCCTALSVGATIAFTPIGGTGGSPYSDSCPQGQVALGQSLYTATNTKLPAEEWVSRFGLLCGTPMPQLACGL